MQKIIVKIGKNKTDIDICYGKETKHILDIPIEFEKHYKEQNKLDKEDIDDLIERVRRLNVVYEDIDIYGSCFFQEINNDIKEDFLSCFKEKTGRSILILKKDEEKELERQGLQYLLKNNF